MSRSHIPLVDTIQQAIVGKSTDGDWTGTNSMAALNEIRLQLKFLNEVRKEVFTVKEIKGEGDNPVRVAMVDESEQIIKSGPGSSSKVEITVHEAKTDENGNNQSHQDIKSDEAKPSFAKTYHVLLDEGIGDLTNAKLSQDSKWTKNCKCQLVARVPENLSDTIKVQEAWSKPFEVSDSRAKLYAKHYPPSPSDPSWRLDKIARGGKPWQRLKDKNILTVRDILFLNSANPQRLHEIICVGDVALKAIIAHAETCKIDDTNLYEYNHPSEDKMTVVFNYIGELIGVIYSSQYIQTSNLSEDLENRARKLLCHAFEIWNRIPHSDGKAFKQLCQCGASTFPINSIQDSVPGGSNGSYAIGNKLTLDSPHCRKSHLATDFGETHTNPESEPNVDQEQGGRGGGYYGVGISGRFSLCPSQFSFSRNTPIQKTPGCNLTSPENINHCDVMVSGGTGPSIRPLGDANNALDLEVCVENDLPGGGNATLDNTAPNERYEDVNSSTDFFCPDEFLSFDCTLEEVFTPLPDVVHTEGGQVFTPESQPGGSVSITNSYQEQTAGTSAEGSEAMLDSHQDLPNWNRPRKRSKNGTGRRVS